MTPLDIKQAAAALSCCNEFTMTITWELMKTRIGVSNFDIDIHNILPISIFTFHTQTQESILRPLY